MTIIETPGEKSTGPARKLVLLLTLQNQKKTAFRAVLFDLQETILGQFDDRASFFQFLLGLCGSIFTNTGEHLGTSGFRHGFGFAEGRGSSIGE